MRPEESHDPTEQDQADEEARLLARSQELGCEGNLALVRYIEGLETENAYLKQKLGW